MKKIVYRIFGIIVLPLVIIGGANYLNDPDYTLNKNYVPTFVNALHEGKMISGPVNSSLREIKKQWINKMDYTPEIFVLGSSRIISLPNVIAPEKTFFNAAVSNCTIQDMYVFLSLFEERNLELPPQITICCDQWLFGSSFSEKRWLENRSEFIQFAKKTGNIPLSDIPPKWEIQKEWITELFSVRYLLRSTPLARHKQEFLIRETFDPSVTTLLPDGTRRSAESITTISDNDKIKLALEYSRQSVDEKFNELDSFQKLLFENLITMLKTKGCHVILYLPPYHPKTFTGLRQDEKSKGVFRANNYIISFAESHNIQVVGATNPADLNLDSSQFYDAVHLKQNSLCSLFKEALYQKPKLD